MNKYFKISYLEQLSYLNVDIFIFNCIDFNDVTEDFIVKNLSLLKPTRFSKICMPTYQICYDKYKLCFKYTVKNKNDINNMIKIIENYNEINTLYILFNSAKNMSEYLLILQTYFATNNNIINLKINTCYMYFTNIATVFDNFVIELLKNETLNKIKLPFAISIPLYMKLNIKYKHKTIILDNHVVDDNLPELVKLMI